MLKIMVSTPLHPPYKIRWNGIPFLEHLNRIPLRNFPFGIDEGEIIKVNLDDIRGDDSWYLIVVFSLQDQCPAYAGYAWV